MKPAITFLSVITLAATLGACNKEPEVVIKTSDGKVVAVEEKKDGTVVQTTKEVVVVKDSTLIGPAVEETLRAQVKAVNNEDLEGAMSYIHPDSAGYAASRTQLADLFDKYELRITLEKVAVVSALEDEAKVDYTQLTEKISGPAFENNRTTGTHTFRKDGGKWKIFDTKVSSITAVAPTP